MSLLTEKWKDTLEEKSAPELTTNYERTVTAQLLENQANHLMEAASTNTTANSQNYDKVLMRMVRRGAVKFPAMNFVGIQAMKSPTDLIFSIHAEYPDNSEALFNEPKTEHSGTGAHVGNDPFDPLYATGKAMPTAQGEQGNFNEMQIRISKTSVTAETRQLKATYSLELSQDLANVHGMSGDDILSGVLVEEINAEIDREIVRNVYASAKVGAQSGTTLAGTVDIDTDTDGRWSREKYEGLCLRIEQESSIIATETRRGSATFVIVSPDIATALSMSGAIDHADANVSDNYIGMFKSRIKVFVDPYSVPGVDFFVVGYKGSSTTSMNAESGAWDSGLYYCPYIPLVRRQAIDPSNLQPVIAFSSRYGISQNAFVPSNAAGINPYFRKVKVTNII